MKIMMKCSVALLTVLSLAVPARAQEFPNEPFEFLMARMAADEGRFDEALTRFDRILSKTPGDPVLRYERAMVLIDSGRVDKAISELRAVTEVSPGFYDANRVLGRVLLERAGNDRKGIEESLRYLQAAFKAYPDDISTGVTVSRILGSLGRADEAERILAAMVERAPDQRLLNFEYAQVLTRVGRAADARVYLEKTVTLDPTFAPAIMPLLDIYQQSSDWQKAADVLAPLIAAEPANLEMQRQQGYFFLRAGDARRARDRFRAIVAGDAQDARSLFYLAESLNDLEEYPEAERIFRQLLEADANDADLVASFGLSLSGQKKWDEATAAFNRLLAIEGLPENLAVLARTQLAYIDLERKHYGAAVETAKNVMVFRDRPNAQAINIALQALRRDEKPAEALALLAPLAERFPNEPFIAARYTEALVRAGDVAKARTFAAAQTRIGTPNAIAAAEALVLAGEQTHAVELMRKASAAKPEDVDLQFQLGSLLERAEDREGAEKVFTALLEKNRDHAPSLNYLGYMWAESGVNLEKAEEMLSRAVGQEPENGAYVDSLGWVYYRLGNLELAEKYLSDATRLLPRDATVHEHLGDVLAKRGDMQRALQLYRTAVDLDPESKDIDQLRSKIAQIERAVQPASR
jgi:predicted Zn-dependent protease